jgi:hypothetical protein
LNFADGWRLGAACCGVIARGGYGHHLSPELLPGVGLEVVTAECLECADLCWVCGSA